MTWMLNGNPAAVNRQKLQEQEDFKQLIEVILDLGRPPEARFLNREVILDQREVTDEDIEYVITRIGSFGDDNRGRHRAHFAPHFRHPQPQRQDCRADTPRRTGCFRHDKNHRRPGGNRKSILLLGRPGVGKTTMLREVARVWQMIFISVSLLSILRMKLRRRRHPPPCHRTCAKDAGDDTQYAARRDD